MQGALRGSACLLALSFIAVSRSCTLRCRAEAAVSTQAQLAAGLTVRSEVLAVSRLESETGAQKGCSGPYAPSGSLKSRSAALGLCASCSLHTWLC